MIELAEQMLKEQLKGARAAKKQRQRLVSRDTLRDAARRAKEASHWLAAIVESSDDAIISKDLDGTITSWNAGAERLFGYSAEEALSRPINFLIPLDIQDEEPEILARLRQGQRVDHYETRRRRKDGTVI